MFKNKPIKKKRRVPVATQAQPAPNNRKPHLENSKALSHLEIKRRLEYLNHVVMIWLERATLGRRTIVMPDLILKGKAKEAAKILNIYGTFKSSHWLQQFQLQMEKTKRNHKYRTSALAKSSMIIAEIVQEEWRFFFGDDESCSIDKANVKRIQEDVFRHGFIEENEKNNDEEEDVWNSPIESTDEALDCLKLLENYALFIRDLKPLKLIDDIEKILLEEKGAEGSIVL